MERIKKKRKQEEIIAEMITEVRGDEKQKYTR